MECTDQGHDRDSRKHDEVIGEVLRDLESNGVAIRYVDPEGRFAWRATLKLCRHMQDLEREAENDLEEDL
jgi:hypothetical protein